MLCTYTYSNTSYKYVINHVVYTVFYVHIYYCRSGKILVGWGHNTLMIEFLKFIAYFLSVSTEKHELSINTFVSIT